MYRSQLRLSEDFQEYTTRMYGYYFKSWYWWKSEGDQVNLIELRHKDNVVEDYIYVVDGNGPTLLGRDVIEIKIGSVNRLPCTLVTWAII